VRDEKIPGTLNVGHTLPTIVQAFIFDGTDLKWWSFASAVALAALSTIGLIAHESNTERVVHELSVTGRDRTPAAV